MNEVIIQEYSLEQLAYLGCITVYFSRLEYVIYEFLRKDKSDDEEKELAKLTFEMLRQQLDKRIKESIIYKNEIAEEYNTLADNIISFQRDRNDYCHSVFTITYRDRDFNLKYNKKKVSKGGLNEITKETSNVLDDFCVKLIEFIKTLSSFLYKFSALEKI